MIVWLYQHDVLKQHAISQDMYCLDEHGSKNKCHHDHNPTTATTPLVQYKHSTQESRVGKSGKVARVEKKGKERKKLTREWDQPVQSC